MTDWVTALTKWNHALQRNLLMNISHLAAKVAGTLTQPELRDLISELQKIHRTLRRNVRSITQPPSLPGQKSLFCHSPGETQHESAK